MKKATKKICLILCTTLVLVGVSSFVIPSRFIVNNASEGDFWYAWEEGIAKAKKENKVVLVDVYTDWCGWCVKMDRDTYAKDSIRKMVNADFVPIKINPEDTTTYLIDGKRYSGVEITTFLAGGKRHRSYPITYFWLDPQKNNDGRRKYLQKGYLDSNTMTQVLSRIKKIKGI